MSSFESGSATLGDVATGVDLYIRIHGVSGVPLMGAGLIDTVVGTTLGKVRPKALLVTKAASKGIPFEPASGKDATSYSTGKTGADGVRHCLSEPMGDGAGVSLTDDCPRTVNTVTERGVKNGTPLADDKMSKHTSGRIDR